MSFCYCSVFLEEEQNKYPLKKIPGDLAKVRLNAAVHTLVKLEKGYCDLLFPSYFNQSHIFGPRPSPLWTELAY